MRRTIATVSLLITLITIVVWIISQFVVPVLPPELGAGVILFFLAFNSVIAMLAGANDILELKDKLLGKVDSRPETERAKLRVADRSVQEESSRLTNSGQTNFEKSTQVYGDIENLTQIEHVSGNVMIASTSTNIETVSVNSLLNLDLSNEKEVDLDYLKTVCDNNVNLHIKRISQTNESIPCTLVTSTDSELDLVEQTWRQILEVDSLHKRSVDSFVEGPARNPPPSGLVADWVKVIQDIEKNLADIAEQSRNFDAFNNAANDIIQKIWSPEQELLDLTGAVTAPVLYMLTRLKIGEMRHHEFAPEQANAFEPLLQSKNSLVFPVGIQQNGEFLYVIVKHLTEQENLEVLSTPPILTGVSNLDSLHALRGLRGGEYVRKFPKQRIDNRITNLSLQILAGHVALLRHLGYWSHVVFMHELLNTSFDPDGFASLLEVTSVALKQKRMLSNPLVENTLVRLPSLDILSAEFDHNESIWYQVNPIRVTQITGEEQQNKCLDPIIDLQVVNYSDVPCVVKEVIFRHYGTWTEVKAMLVYGLLESAKTYDIDVSFDQPVSIYSLNPPLFVAPNSPGRFKLRLLGFRSKCPGSDTLIQLGLKYNNEVCDTQIYHMDIKG